MSTNPLPPGWTELKDTSSDDEFDDALRLLKQTHPLLTYVGLGRNRAASMTGIPRGNDGVSRTIYNLRLFWADDKAMSLLYFYKTYGPERAYCMTIGVDTGLLKGEITERVNTMCLYMQGQPGGRRLEVNSTDPTPRFRKRPELDAAFADAKGGILRVAPEADSEGKIKVGFPWPDEVYAWVIHPIPKTKP